MCVDAGAHALGFNFWQGSRRVVSLPVAAEIIRSLPPFVTTVGVFVNERIDVVAETMRACRLDVAQLHGDESPGYCRQLGGRIVKAFRVGPGRERPLADYDVSAFLLDTYVPGDPGGTGTRFDWNLAREARQHGPVILAGGLTPENVAEAIRVAQPYAVDVSSGVEQAPGVKDADAVRRFIAAASE